MNYFKKHEFVFGFIILLSFLVPFLLNKAGVITSKTEVFSLILMAVIAIIPTIIWIMLFNKEHHESKNTLIFAFLGGCTSTIPIFFYQHLFESQIINNFIFFKLEAVNYQQNISNLFGFSSLGEVANSVSMDFNKATIALFCIYLGVGVSEEIVKQAVVNTSVSKYLAFFATIIGIGFIATDFSGKMILFVIGLLLVYFVFLKMISIFIKLKSIDDVIEVAIVGALGFAFVENILYFVNKFGTIPYSNFAFFVFGRTTIVTVVHILCSGIMAYHIGMAYFAKPLLRDEIRSGRKFRFIRFMHKVLQLPTESIFKFEQITFGVFMAVLVHALYDFFMQMGDFGIRGLPVSEVVMASYFIGGLWYLFSLLEKKEDHKEFGHLIIKEDYV